MVLLMDVGAELGGTAKWGYYDFASGARVHAGEEVTNAI